MQLSTTIREQLTAMLADKSIEERCDILHEFLSELSETLIVITDKPDGTHIGAAILCFRLGESSGKTSVCMQGTTPSLVAAFRDVGDELVDMTKENPFAIMTVGGALTGLLKRSREAALPSNSPDPAKRLTELLRAIGGAAATSRPDPATSVDAQAPDVEG